MNLYYCVLGEYCNISTHVEIGRGVKIGDRCRIGSCSFIPEGVEIEDDVFIGPGVVFCNDRYPPSDGWKTGPKTVVRKGAAIGANSSILPGITIGPGALVGAGSVVTHNVPAGALVAGNPAREIERKQTAENTP